MSNAKARKLKVAAPIQGIYEPVLSVSFMPACANCGAVHPRARRPALDQDTCPDCNAPALRGAPVEVPAVLTGRSPSILFARFLFAAAAYLRKIAEGL